MLLCQVICAQACIAHGTIAGFLDWVVIVRHACHNRWCFLSADLLCPCKCYVLGCRDVFVYTERFRSKGNNRVYEIQVKQKPRCGTMYVHSLLVQADIRQLTALTTCQTWALWCVKTLLTVSLPWHPHSMLVQHEHASIHPAYLITALCSICVAVLQSVRLCSSEIWTSFCTHLSCWHPNIAWSIDISYDSKTTQHHHIFWPSQHPHLRNLHVNLAWHIYMSTVCSGWLQIVYSQTLMLYVAKLGTWTQ